MEAHSYSVQIKKFKEEQKQKIMANFNSFVKYDIKDPFIQGFDGEKKDNRSPSQKTADEINNDKWDSNDISFLEGFYSKDKDNHLVKEAKFRRMKRSETRQGERLTERLKPFRFQKQSSKLVSR